MIYRTDFSKEHEGPCFESVLWPLTLNAFSYRKNKGKTALKQRSKLGSVLPQFCLCFVCVLSTLNAPIDNNLFAPDLLIFLMDFSQVWYRWKAVFKGNPMPYVTKCWDYSLWKTLATTEIAPPRASW